MAGAAWREDRGVLRIAGPDARTFLQGLVSNDVAKASPERAIYATLLTAQGRWLHDFFLVEQDGALLLEGEAARLADLKRRLSIYKLRSKVTLESLEDRAVAVAWPADALPALGLPAEAGAARALPGGALAFVDPRLAELGARVIAPASARDAAPAGLPAAPLADYDRHRLALGVPESSRDLVAEKSILLENGIDALNGVDWQKGCYIGQELTARTKYRGLVKKRLIPVAVDGPLPAPGTPVMLGEREAGELRSGADGLALALLRLEMLDASAAEGLPLTAEGARLTPRRPPWMQG